MIKNYNEFIKESNYDDLEFEEIIVEIGSEEGGSSYSDMCKTNDDPDEDFNRFQKRLDELGWTIEKIGKEFSDNELNRIYDFCDSQNGLVDIYFYKLFEKLNKHELKEKVSLGGHGWEDYHVNEDEAFIRYSYGYHNTKYGKLAILNYGTMQEFIDQALTYLQEYLYNDLSSNIVSLYDSHGGFRRLTGESNWDILNIKEYSIAEDDRFIIYTQEIADFLNQFPLKDGKGVLSDVHEVEAEDISSKISKFLEAMNLDMEFTGNELIIWGKFEEA